MSNTIDLGFDFNNETRPRAFIQWKGTDACFDFHCECGKHSGYSGFFAHFIKCPKCEHVFEMPYTLFPRKVVGKRKLEIGLTPLECDEEFR